VGWHLAHVFGANAARAILSHNAHQAIGACWRVKAAAIDIGFVTIFYAVVCE